MKKYMNVLIRDTVKLVLNHYHPPATIIGIVKEVTERIGNEHLIKIDPIQDERPPKISEISLDVFNSFSIHFVKEIINRPKQKGRPVQRPPKNHFLHEREYSEPIRKGVKAGNLSFLIMRAMKKASIEVIDIDFEKSFALWKKQKPGLIKNMHGLYYVHWKPFQKWVLRNQTKLIMGRKDIKKEVIKRNKEYEKQYWEDVDQELANDFGIFDVNRGLAEQLDQDWKLYYN